MADVLPSASSREEVPEGSARRVDAFEGGDDFREMLIARVGDPAVELPLRLPGNAGERVGGLSLVYGIRDERCHRREGWRGRSSLSPGRRGSGFSVSAFERRRQLERPEAAVCKLDPLAHADGLSPLILNLEEARSFGTGRAVEDDQDALHDGQAYYAASAPIVHERGRDERALHVRG